ncbi:MAG: glycosyltransferase [Bryobacteraceae bacterium]|nr:glycosyltransferase [Bryobacteraceae bacterium]
MQPKRILFTTLGSLGDLFPYLAVASEMQSRGHLATILTTAQHRSRVERSGVPFREAAPNLNFADKTFQLRAMHETNGSRYMLRDVMLPQIRVSYENMLEASAGADLLVTQMLTFAGPIVAEKTGIPWVSTVLAPLSYFSYQDSPVLSSRLNGLREAAPRLNAFINRVARSTTQSWNSPVYQLRRELGLGQGLEPIYEGQHSPLKALAMFSPLLAQPQADWPPGALITGFPFWEEPRTGTEMPDELDRFLADGPPPVVFTPGSSAVLNPGQFYEESVKAARQLGVRAVLLDGEKASGRQAGRDILRLAYASHSYLFPKASVIVHSGGAGTCAQAMRSGRPSLVTPFAYDQPDNALRLVRLTIARTIRRDRYTARRAASEIETLLNDQRYRTNAERIARIVEAENGVAVACDVLERCL